MNSAEWCEIIVWWLLLIPAIAFSLLPVPLSIYAFVADVWGGSSKILTALMLPGVILFSIGIGYFLARVLARQTLNTIRLSKQRRGYRPCRRCGYSLTGNISGVCPECGTAWRNVGAQ